MSTFNVYVGSDNDTGKLDITRIKNIVMRMHRGWTIHRATGSWDGIEEDSLIVTIQGETGSILQTVNMLKSELSQQAVGYQQMPDIQYA